MSPDISKCTGEGCPLKKECYRYTAKDSQWQSYTESAYDEDEDSCENYWEVK